MIIKVFIIVLTISMAILYLARPKWVLNNRNKLVWSSVATASIILSLIVTSATLIYSKQNKSTSFTKKLFPDYSIVYKK